METTIERPQATTKQKANIDLKIELPNSEKPFFNKMATENNMLTQVKKAGTKLDENQSLTVSIADRTINLTKEETSRADLKSVIQEKIIDREINKGAIQSNTIQEFQGERNGVYQKLWVTSDNNNQLYTTEHLEFAEKDGKQVVDADLTKWKSISNEAYSKIDDEMHMKGAIKLEVVGEVIAPFRNQGTDEVNKGQVTSIDLVVEDDYYIEFDKYKELRRGDEPIFNLDFNLQELKENLFTEYLEIGDNAPDFQLTPDQLAKVPDVMDSFKLDDNLKNDFAKDGKIEGYNGTTYIITQENIIVREELTGIKSLVRVSEVSFKENVVLERGETVQEVNESERSATANEISARNFSYEMGFDKSNESSDKSLDFLKEQIKFLGFGEDKDLHERLKEKLYHMQHSNETGFDLNTSSDKTSFQNKITFDLIFNKSKDTDRVFLNKFEARLTNEKKGLELEHTFSVKTNGFTAKQAINLLEGRAVKTELTNPNTQEKEPAFVKLKLNEPKNENGNFKLQVFNKNYGVNTASIVDKSSLVFKDEKHREITIKSLEKGNIVAVKFTHEGKEQEGKAVLNPQYKTLNLYDQHMKRLNTNAPVLENSFKDSASHQVKAQQHQSRKL